MQLAIGGDLRFLSHHDMMRAIERISGRAKLPLRYSQGFNPRPVFSLTSPRPVGVATRDDRLVLALDDTIDRADLLARLNRSSPEGMRFLAARLLEDVKTLHPVRVSYELALFEGCIEAVTGCVEELQSQPAWLVRRKAKVKPGRKRKPAGNQEIRLVDIRPMLGELEVSGGMLRFVCVSRDGVLARPGEVLQLVGLVGLQHMAELVRTEIEDDFQKFKE